MRSILSLAIITCLLLSCGSPSKQTENSESVSSKGPESLPGLIAFWDFQDGLESDHVSKGANKYVLSEMNGPIRKVDDGIFGSTALDLEWGQWMRAKREDVPLLDLHGSDQELSMVVWLKRESDTVWQFIAGMWNEGDEVFKGKAGGTGPGSPSRQYAMFINGAWQSDYTTYERTRAKNQAMGYISPYGGATPDHPFAFDYATGKTFLEKGKWYMIAYTFDGKAISVYVNGKLDSNGNYNPFMYDGPIYEPQGNGTDFTVALRDHPKWPTYPEGKPINNEGFDGVLGGLAVYDRAISADEIFQLYKSTMPKE